MFFRMLKKDITEKKGLNIILLIFMCLASTLTVCSAIVLYANGIGYNRTLKRLNAAEVTVLAVRNLDDEQGRQDAVRKWLDSCESVDDVELSECIVFYSNAVDYESVDEEMNSTLIHRNYYAFAPDAGHNKATDMDGNLLDIPYGSVAVSQYIHNIGGAEIGDKVRIVTQLGNIYEFKICAFTKDPSMNGWYRLFFNPEDYDVLRVESPVIADAYMIDMCEGAEGVEELGVINYFSEMEDAFGEIVASYTSHGYNPDHESSVLLNVIMMICSVFLIIMVFMTVSFTIKTAIKSEEKELGMLKALGVESVSFNWLFAAKYLAISLVGMVVGFFAGIHLAGLDLKYLCYDELKPSFIEIIPIALAASLMIFVLILIFVAFALRRMKKISIMDVIAGENRGERFKKLPGIFLHKIGRINIPFYLALTDLTNMIKRYSFLIIAYTMALTLLLAFIEVRATANSKYWITKYWGYPDFDFAMDLPDQVEEKYIERGGNIKGAYDIVNKELQEADIPAKLDYFLWCDVTTEFNGNSHASFLQYHIPGGMYTDVYEGVRPKLRNEVMLDAYHAEIYGINIGDTISVEYFRFNDDGLTSALVSEDFLVTGTTDKPMADLTVFMSDEFKDGARYWVTVIPGRIDAPEDMKPYYIEKMRSMYGKTSIRMEREQVEYSLGDMMEEFDLLLWVLVPIMLTMVVLATVLYQSVNIIDETPDIALLKCSGFSEGNIKAWQMMRSVMLVAVSSVLSVIFLNTIVLMLLRKAFYALGSIVNYVPNRNIIAEYIGLPVTAVIIVAVTIFITLGNVKKIEICRIRED